MSVVFNSSTSIQKNLTFREFRNLRSREMEDVITASGAVRMKGPGITKKGSHQAFVLDGKKFTFAPHAGRTLARGSAHALYKILSDTTHSEREGACSETPSKFLKAHGAAKKTGIVAEKSTSQTVMLLPPAAVAGAETPMTEIRVAAEARTATGKAEVRTGTAAEAEPVIADGKEEAQFVTSESNEEVFKEKETSAIVTSAKKTTKKKRAKQKKRISKAQESTSIIQLRSLDHFFQEVLLKEHIAIFSAGERRIYEHICGLIEQGADDLTFLFQEGVRMHNDVMFELLELPIKLGIIYGSQLEVLSRKEDGDLARMHLLEAVQRIDAEFDKRIDEFFNMLAKQREQVSREESASSSTFSLASGVSLSASSTASSFPPLRDSKPHDTSLTTTVAGSLLSTAAASLASGVTSLSSSTSFSSDS